jgi:hypothetical protein
MRPQGWFDRVLKKADDLEELTVLCDKLQQAVDLFMVRSWFLFRIYHPK